MKSYTTWAVDRLSRKWVGPFTVGANGEPVTDWTYLLLPVGTRPDNPSVIDRVPVPRTEGLGMVVGPDSANVLESGRYAVWIRWQGGLEAPVYGAFAIIVIL